MASLRARLLVAVLAITAVALLLLGGITYVEQRSFELDRVDQAARTAGPAVRDAVEQQGVDTGGGPPPRHGRPPRPGIGLVPGPTARCATPTGT
jgi:hypothetical protein